MHSGKEVTMTPSPLTVLVVNVGLDNDVFPIIIILQSIKFLASMPKLYSLKISNYRQRSDCSNAG